MCYTVLHEPASNITKTQRSLLLHTEFSVSGYSSGLKAMFKDAIQKKYIKTHFSDASTQ